jgi:transcriptional regulator with XRE-family HTH domain
MQVGCERILLKLGARIRELRKRRSLSQEQFGKLTGLHRTYIGDIERGVRNLSLSNLCRIATALDLTVSDLLADINTELGPDK